MQIIVSGEKCGRIEIFCKKGKCRAIVMLSQKEKRARISLEQTSRAILSDVRISTSVETEIRRSGIRWMGQYEYLEREGAFFYLSAKDEFERIEIAFDYIELKSDLERMLAEKLFAVSRERGILEELFRKSSEGLRTDTAAGKQNEALKIHFLNKPEDIPDRFTCSSFCELAERLGGQVYFRNQLIHYECLKEDVICIDTESGAAEAEKLAEELRISGKAPFLMVWGEPAPDGGRQSLVPAVYLPEQYKAELGPSLRNSFQVVSSRGDGEPPAEPEEETEDQQTGVSVDIIIPTWNGGEMFRKNLPLLLRQQGVPNCGVIIVDSGSTDGTPEFAEQNGYGRLQVIRIPHESFSHSYARNLGAERSEADILVFMTQDACPSSRQWLRKLVQPLLEDCAAASCAEMCPPYADSFFRIASYEYSNYIGTAKGDQKNRYNDFDDEIEFRRKASLSDVTCAVRRQVFREFLYENDYAEDLNLGMRLLKAGYRIALLSSVQTIHYHNRNADYYLRRNFVESRHFRRIFGDQAEALPKEQLMYIIADTLECIQGAYHQLDAETAAASSPERLIECFCRLLMQVHYQRADMRGNIPEALRGYEGPVEKIYWSAVKGLENVQTYFFFNPLLQQICEYLRGPFITFIKAAGNDGTDVKKELLNCVVKRAANEFGAYLSGAAELWPGADKELSAGI